MASPPLHLFLSAAEPSGDRLAAELLAALRQRGPVTACGVAGPEMRAAGVLPVAHTEDLSVMGLVEVLRHLRRIKDAAEIAGAGLAHGADAFIGVDAPDFHLPLARQARALGIPAVGYVSPQVWAWRKGRTRSISQQLDMLMCLFAFEPTLYPDLDARWVGHPVRDRVPVRGPVEPALYGLLPGSRVQELSRMLPDFLGAADIIRQHRPEARFRLPLRDELASQLPTLPDYIERTPPGVEGLRGARAALTKSGTVTLELAAMGVPQVVAHRVHPITHFVGRRVVRGIRHIALPNILAGREVVPEFVQRFSPRTLAEAVLALPEQQSVDLSAVGQGGAAGRAADTLLDFLGR
ncbi:MAG: lipid-A-disaccharide synthase [Myxococcota bacterium]|jgi:lipid-A-disaccharide synthase